MEKHVYEAMFYGGTFAIGLLASLCRLVHERGHRDNRDLAAVSFQGGLWSFGVLGILVTVCGLIGLKLSSHTV